jgi:hypothetical protein
MMTQDSRGCHFLRSGTGGAARRHNRYAGLARDTVFAAVCVAFGCGVGLGAGGAWAQEPPSGEGAPTRVAEPAAVTNEAEGGAEDAGPNPTDTVPEPAAPLPEGVAPSDEAKPRRPGAVDVVHGAISRRVLATAEWLDSFFDDPRFVAEENRTTLKLGMDYVAERDSRPEFTTPVSARIRLPKLQEKARLVVSGAPEGNVDGQAPETGTAASRLPGARESDVTTSLDYFLRATRRVNISFRVGARFRDGEPELFVQPRYRKLWEFDPLALRFAQDFKWWTEFGWESTTTFDLERPVSERLFFRTTLQGAWTEQDRNTYYYSLGFNLRQVLSPRRVMQYELVNGFQSNAGSELQETRITVRYRQRVWRDWMFLEAAPYASFRRERDFDYTPGILLRLEMFFGRWEGIGL